MKDVEKIYLGIDYKFKRITLRQCKENYFESNLMPVSYIDLNLIIYCTSGKRNDPLNLLTVKKSFISLKLFVR